MKKLYAFFAAALLAAPTFAQKEVVLVSPNDGKEYKDGETMIITPEVDPEWGDVTFHSPKLKNTGKESLDLTMKFAPSYTFGSFQCCMGGNCQMYKAGDSYEVGVYGTAPEALKAGASIDLLTEWNCLSYETFDYEPGECTCTMEFYAGGQKVGAFTVKYIYSKGGETEGIQQTAVSAQQQKVYDLQGRAAVKGAKGLLIQGGKKVLVK